MDYLTQIPGGFAQLEGGLFNVNFPATSFLNLFGPSQPISTYYVEDDASGPSLLTNGDQVSPVVNGTPIPGSYLGSGVLSNSGVSFTIPVPFGPNYGLSITLNPINVHYFGDENGTLYMISEQPLNQDHFSVTVSATGPGLNYSQNVSLSGLQNLLESIPIIGPLVNVAGNVTQQIMNTVAISTTYDPNGTKQLPDWNYCFTSGTMIVTADGTRNIEDLVVGDRLLTIHGGFRAIRWMASRRILGAMMKIFPELRPVRISAGSLAKGIPSHDLVVSQQHRMFISSALTLKFCDEPAVLIPAIKLVGLPGITLEEGLGEVCYHHFLFSSHDIVLANGAWSESLFTGPMVLRTLPPEARREIALIMPEILRPDYVAEESVPFVRGKSVRRLLRAITAHNKPLYAPIHNMARELKHAVSPVLN